MKAKEMNPDLKWLAQNVTEWKGDAQHGYIYMIFDGYDVDYAKRPGEGRFHYTQWRDARISLKLETEGRRGTSIKGDVIIAVIAAIALACAGLLSVAYP